MALKSYVVNEVFYSVQGEGMRAGTPNVFVRLSGCNLTCTRDGEAGFDCDTEFVSGRRFTLLELVKEIADTVNGPCPGIILTGGEPSLQVDDALVDGLRTYLHGAPLCIETNGTNVLPAGIDWIACSPKSAEHTLRVGNVEELRYVRNAGQGIPRPSLKAENYLLSPAFRTNADGTHEPEPGALEWCIRLVKENPTWRLSVQQHKAWRVR